MLPSERAGFLERIVVLSELYGKSLSPAVQAIYAEALADVPMDGLLRAMSAAARTCTFMPKPAEIRTLALGDPEEQAEVAWIALRQAMGRIGAYDSLVTRDPALGETILALFGSWPAACASDFSSEMWASKRKEFGRIYRVMQQRHREGARYLPGVVEQQNAGREDWRHYAGVGVIEAAGAVRKLGPGAAEELRTLLAAEAGRALPEATS